MLPAIHITIPGYALMTGIGVFCALSLAYNRNERFQFSIKEILALCVVNFGGAAIGSKILFFLVGIPEWIDDFSFRLMIEKFVTSGFVFYGGLLGAMLGVVICCNWLNMEKKRVFNFLVPAYLAFHACGRIGCLLAGCCYGKESVFGLVMADGTRRIPVQLLEAICILVILLIILRVEKNNEDYDLLGVYLLIYPVCRFALEYLRGDEIRGLWAGVSTSQWISLIIISVNLFIRMIKRIHRVFGKGEEQ